MTKKITRRDFTKLAAGAAGVTAATTAVHAARKLPVSPNEKIGVALIGCGGMGGTDLRDFLKIPEVECRALCDVDQERVKGGMDTVTSRGGKPPATFEDFRHILDMKEVDAVIICTPDHWHALPTILACQAGKDVYVEKPLALTIGEGRVMVEAAKKHKRIVQMGTQQRSANHFRHVCNMVREGQVGKIRLVRSWAYLDWVGDVPVKDNCEAPEGVNYDLWLGPARKRSFNPNRFHFHFRWFWDYAGGLMTDWGAHMIDIVNLAMNVKAPRSAMSVGGKYGYPNDAQETPDTQQAILEYDDYSVIWEHAIGLGRGPHDREHGIAFHGNNGILVVDRLGWEILSETDMLRKRIREYKMKPIPKQEGSKDYHLKHVSNFVDCLRSRKRPASNIEVSHDSMKACHLANIALRTGRKVDWDDDKEQIINDPEANKLLMAHYREPWALPKI